jgi:hypothetical protein
MINAWRSSSIACQLRLLRLCASCASPPAARGLAADPWRSPFLPADPRHLDASARLVASGRGFVRSWRFPNSRLDRVSSSRVAGIASRPNMTRAYEYDALCHNAIRRCHRLMSCLVAGICPEHHLGLNLAIAIDNGRRQGGRKSDPRARTFRQALSAPLCSALQPIQWRVGFGLTHPSIRTVRA